ncbi:uncharacterized protein L969DRAFT_14082 [Mixia osmundae IAM 14324]|uniref:uncharacterized protein n=1 Tax=Mixia osmundae (strain CBS 9802 / IAM 14324 / JCM 22182 / KY 12970) TaxID=764103 RepID=UPI0004A54D5A|nr:uncharacterized protein L969DRAFT_14082 [Mixia osmundae IAM 14324]KEI41860.1 hypothetical protein L969DRAFT_14082 [Mixia osmundae IAM 14324]
MVKKANSARTHLKAATLGSHRAKEEITPMLVQEPLQASEPSPYPPAAPSRVDKGAERRKILLRKVQASTQPHPYSKSHARRLKRKEKTNLAGASLSELQDALQQTTETVPAPTPDHARQHKIKQSRQHQTEPLAAKSPAQSTAKLTTAKRAKMIEAESKRLPAILNHKAFAANPFAAIRQHAKNTLSTL